MMNDKAHINQFLPSGQQPNLPSFPSGGMFGGGSGLPAPQNGGSSGSSKFSLSNLMRIIEKMGGIQGIMSTIERVQNIVVTIQQFAPLIALLIPKRRSAQNELPVPVRSRPKRRKRKNVSRKRRRARK